MKKKRDKAKSQRMYNNTVRNNNGVWRGKKAGTYKKHVAKKKKIG
jgi:hypothetical protein